MSKLFFLKIKNLTMNDLSLGWIIFFSIFYQKLAPIGFAILIISVILNFREYSFQTFSFKSFLSPSFWFIAYYAFLLIAMFWTDNIAFGLSKLENKLTFVLFPLIFSFFNKTLSLKKMMNVFLFALIFSIVLYEILGIWNFLTIKNNSFQYSFSGSGFVYFMHRSYFGCYLVVGIILLLEQIRKETIFWKVVLVIIYSIGVLQTNSKAGILCMFLVFTIYGIVFMLGKNRWFGWILFVGLSIIFSLIFLTKNPIKKRFDASWTAIEMIKTENNSTVESNEVRLIMWKTSWEVWKSNFVFGTGTGDYNDELNSYNLKKGNLGAANEELNSHNQFLNTSVQLGIFGLLVLCMIFISTFIVSGNSIWKIMILITFIVNFLVESFLETQSGIVLFCIILIFFLTNQEHTKSKTISTQ